MLTLSTLVAYQVDTVNISALMPFLIFILATVNIAIGTQSFVFSGLLGELASTLSVSLGTAGQWVPASAITVAVVSPLAMSGLAGYARQRVIPRGLAVLSVGNPIGALAPICPALRASLTGGDLSRPSNPSRKQQGLSAFSCPGLTKPVFEGGRREDTATRHEIVFRPG
jgi:hypothetical protein